jgi:putative AdoMet-dependent methyltransferase
MVNLFPPSEFDDWAIHYDRDVIGSNNFPFNGYQEVLRTIFKLAKTQSGANILDLGIGTGNLSLLFANQGCKIWGADFSKEMLAQAQLKIPDATLEQIDIREEWPSTLQRCFNVIVSAYTFHHFPLDEKVNLIQRLLHNNLSQSCQIIIGDIAFRNSAQEGILRNAMGSDWEQEYYWIADSTLDVFSKAGISVRFKQVSSCAGTFQFHIEL